MNKSESKPALVFEQFAKINEIPRPSKHEEIMIEFLKSFGESHQLETLVDETGNVLIRKAALQATSTLKPSACRVTWTWFATNWWMWISTSTEMQSRLT